jgi:hypothetical protein
MKLFSEECWQIAINTIRDESIFSQDQITMLEKLIYDIKNAVKTEISENT